MSLIRISYKWRYKFTHKKKVCQGNDSHSVLKCNASSWSSGLAKFHCTVLVLKALLWFMFCFSRFMYIHTYIPEKAVCYCNLFSKIILFLYTKITQLEAVTCTVLLQNAIFCYNYVLQNYFPHRHYDKPHIFVWYYP